MGPSLTDLPEEVLLIIFTFVRPPDLKSLRRVNVPISALIGALLFKRLVTPRLDKQVPFDENWVIGAEQSVPWSQLHHVRELSFGVYIGLDGLPTADTALQDRTPSHVLHKKLRCMAELFWLIWDKIDKRKLTRIGLLSCESLGQSASVLKSFKQEYHTALVSLKRLEIVTFPDEFAGSANDFFPGLFWAIRGSSQLESLYWRGIQHSESWSIEPLLAGNARTLRDVTIESLPESFTERLDLRQLSSRIGSLTFPLLDTLRLMGTPFEGPADVDIYPGAKVLQRQVVDDLKTLVLADIPSGLTMNSRKNQNRPSHLERFEVTAVRHYRHLRPEFEELLAIMGRSAILRDCFVSIWDYPSKRPASSGTAYQPFWQSGWPSLASAKSRTCKRLVLEEISLRHLRSEVRDAMALFISEPRSLNDVLPRPLSGETTTNNVLGVKPLMTTVTDVDPECLAVSFDLREVHNFAVSLYRVARATSSTKLLHLRWPGLIKKHAPKAWNSSWIFDWPNDPDWFRRVNGFSEESEIIISIFNVCLAYSTSKIPHDLQKIVHWAFGPQGFPELQVIAFGDFGSSGGEWLDSTALFCRNDAPEPWGASYNGASAETALSIRPNFRTVHRSDWRLQDLVEENMDFLTACPCKSQLEDLHRQESLGDQQGFDSRFEIIRDESETERG